MTTGSKRATTKTAQILSMKGAGYHSQRTRGAKNVIDNAADMLFDAVHALPKPLAGQPVRIADFGAADGGTSKKAIRDTVAEIRSRFPDCQIQVTYTDLPSNDFSVLFRNMLGVAEESSTPILTNSMTFSCTPAAPVFTSNSSPMGRSILGSLRPRCITCRKNPVRLTIMYTWLGRPSPYSKLSLTRL